MREGYELQLDFLHVDCEVGLFEAAREVFPGVKPILCYFHTQDSIRRKKIAIGLPPLCRRSESLATWVSYFSSVFWFPTSLIPRLWGLMYEQLDDDLKAEPKVEEMKRYMEANWIPTSLPIAKGSTRFDPFFTNLFSCPDDDTNNNVSEGYNSRLSKRLGSHPNIFNFAKGKAYLYVVVVAVVVVVEDVLLLLLTMCCCCCC